MATRKFSHEVQHFLHHEGTNLPARSGRRQCSRGLEVPCPLSWQKEAIRRRGALSNQDALRYDQVSSIAIMN